METTSIKQFYKEMFGAECPNIEKILNDNTGGNIGHFNVFNIGDIYAFCKNKSAMPYNRRTYYKISLINGRNNVQYADREINIDKYAVLFASPKVPYHYTPQDENQSGHFCVFTHDFLSKSITGLSVDEFPIFKPGSEFIFQINEEQFKEIEQIYKKMHQEIASDYSFKYDLLRNYVIELIHMGQKLKPIQPTENHINASTRISSLFIELLERQFPIASPTQALRLRTAKDYADTLRVHVNHLNKVLKENTGKTTTEIITARIVQEARILLKQTDWNISEIAFSLGFEEVAHFSNFFKKHTQHSPLAYREQLFELYK